MRKKLLILALFITFSMSYKEETKAASNSTFVKELLLKIQGQKPMILTVYPGGSINTTKGNDILFSIKFIGSPKPSYKVYKDNKQIFNSSKYKIEMYKDEDKVAVIIYNIDTSDAGKYKIVISNELGSDEVTFDINVADK